MLNDLPIGHTLVFKSSDGSSGHVTAPEDCTRAELIEVFENYLRLAGYGFDGHLEFIAL